MQEFRKRRRGPAGNLPGMPAWKSELLLARGVDTPEKAALFLNPELSRLHDPGLMQDMDRAVGLIRRAIRLGQRIMVYGDYDVDGVSAVTILLETLREEGAQADFFIPSRHGDGYGLNADAVRRIAETCQLLITVDCGIASVKEVALARGMGMTVIVTDHHEVPEQVPDADAVLNPLLGGYPFRRLCGAGVALKICQAMQGMAGVERKLEVAALATVADVVPLTDENRIIVRAGTERMPRTERPGLRALMEAARVSSPPRAEDIAFRLAPRINAAGRMEDAAQAVTLLMTRDPEEGRRIAEHMEENNRLRQSSEQAILKEAMALLPGQVDLRRDRAVVLEGEGWNTGLIGLAAGRLCERFHHPAVVLSRQGDTAVGSCRSVEGVNIWEMLNLCGDLLIRFGGHAQAAGLTVSAENIPAFRQRLNQAIRENCRDSCFRPVAEYDAELPLDQVSLDMIAELDALEPTGFGNPAPVFLVKGADLQEARRVGKDGAHLKLSLLEGGAVRDGIAFGLGDAAAWRQEKVDALFTPGRNEYNGRVSPQLQVQALRPAREQWEGGQDFFLSCLQEMTLLSAKKAEHIPEAPSLRPEYLLKERLEALDPSRDGLGKVYLALKRNPGADLKALAGAAEAPEEQILFALTAFEQLGFVTWTPEPFRVTLLPVRSRMELDQSPVVRYLRDLAGA